MQRWIVWTPNLKLLEGKGLIHLLSTKGLTPLGMRRTLSNPDGLLIIFSTEESPMVINWQVLSKNTL